MATELWAIGLVISAMLGINFDSWFTIPRKRPTFVTVEGT